MALLVYDGSFEGWLTAVFEVYEYRLADVQFVVDGTYNHALFYDPHTVITDEDKTKRVRDGLLRRVSADAVHGLYRSFLSEQPGIENTLLQYVQYAFASPVNMENDFSNPAVLKVNQVAKQVHREKHRMEAFVRFQLTGDQLYYALIQPDYNVLPLISSHFEKRYADQRWLIYDSKRKYGVYYDLNSAWPVQINFDGSQDGRPVAAIYDEQEQLYQQLWQQYFTSVNIPARNNRKLHLQHMPVRYWKNLVEKMPRTTGRL